MNEECINKNSDPVYIKASITEQILLACIDQLSFSEIHSKIQRIIPTSELVLREYLFYLVNNSFISSNGIRKEYLIEFSGSDLLEIIYIQAVRRIVDYANLTIKIE